MDPVQKIWLYESWGNEQELQVEMARAQSILTGSFSNPDMARNMIRRENPQFKSSDQDLEQSWKIVEESVKEEEGEKISPRKRRKKRKKLLR